MPPTWLYWPAAAAAWAPTDLASLYAWYKADAITGLNDGDPVSTWADSSGNGYDLTQTSTARPLYQTNELNGLPVIEFDGTNDYLEASTAADWKFLHDSTGSTVFTVWKAGTTANPGGIHTLLDTGGRSTAHGCWMFYNDTSPADDRFITQVAFGVPGVLVVNNVTSNGTHAANTATIVSATTDPGNATAADRSSVRFNGGAATTNNADTSAASTSNPTSALHVGSERLLQSYLDGYIAELVIFDAILSDPDRQDVEGYLAHKWGLEGNLPAGHDHKTSPP